jgi:hypothetical protein
MHSAELYITLADQWRGETSIGLQLPLPSITLLERHIIQNL